MEHTAKTRSAMPWPFWLALLLLAANDHLFKGSGRVPAALTGKLSDFAGLIVAPLLLCALLRARSDGARALAFAAVATPFAALKLIPSFAAGAAELLTQGGLPSRIVCDPSDLLALTVLPWAWRMAVAMRPTRAGEHSWLQRIGLAAAALACTATSIDAPEMTLVRSPFAVNWTRFDLRVRVSAELSTAQCQAAEPRNYTLAPGEMIELVPLPSAQDAGTVDLPRVPCAGTARVVVDDGPEVHVSWSERAGALELRDLLASNPGRLERTWQVDEDDDWVFARAVAISGAPGALELHVGSELQEGEEP